MNRIVSVSALLLALVAAPATALTWEEPKSGISFPVQRDSMTLLGGGLRVKKIVVTFKAYAVAFYVADDAASGPLAPFRGHPESAGLHQALQTGDFRKQVVLRFMRDLSRDRIRGAMREALEGADAKLLDQFIGYFPEVKEGQECVMRVLPGGRLEVVMAGEPRPVIADRGFAERVMGLYVGPTPLQADFKAGMVARAGDVLR